MSENVREMYLIPKETFLRCMEGTNASQRERLQDVNVEQLNVSCGPLFAGVKNESQQDENAESEKREEKKKIALPKVHREISVTPKSDHAFPVKAKEPIKKQSASRASAEIRKVTVAPEKTPSRKIDPITGKIDDPPAFNARVVRKSDKNKPQPLHQHKSAEDTVFQRIMSKYRGKKVDVLPEPARDSSPEEEGGKNAFTSRKISPPPQFASDFARRLSQKRKGNPLIRLNSTTYESEGEDNVFAAETRRLSNVPAEKAVEESIQKDNPASLFRNLFPADASRQQPSAEDQINKSIEKTLRTGNEQEEREIEKSRQKTSSPIRVENLASRFENNDSSIPLTKNTNLKDSRKKPFAMGTLGVETFYNSKGLSPPKRPRTRSEKELDAHKKRREKIKQGIDIPDSDTPKRVTYNKYY